MAAAQWQQVNGAKKYENGWPNSRPAKRGCFKRGGFPIWTCPSFFVPFCPFWDFPDLSGIFPICSGMVRGFSRFVPFLFLGLLTAPTRNSPERVRDTIWTFPEKSGQPPGLETPGLASPNKRVRNRQPKSSAVPRRGRSKNAVGHRNTQKSAKERKCKSAKERKRERKGAKERNRALTSA